MWRSTSDSPKRDPVSDSDSHIEDRLTSACGPAIAYNTGRTRSAVPSSSNFPASHLGLRKATRAVSRMYDDFLQDVGVNITQVSQLRPIRAEKEISVSTL
jgi:hypothetical protein